MTKEEATRQVQGFFALHQLDSPGLNDQGQGGASLEGGMLFFEYLPSEGALKCSTLIYQFRGVPEPKVVAAFQEEAKAADTGGGSFEYAPVHRGAFLVRTYLQPVEAETFAAELTRLVEAGRVWRYQGVERVADRAFGRKG